MRIGILSFAHVHAEHYLSVLRTLPDVDLVGFWDDGGHAGTQDAAALGLPRFPTPEALLAAGLDGALVCSETSRHRELVELAAGAGVHVLCEKPIAVTLDDARAMRDACEARGVVFMTAFPMRFDPSGRALRHGVRGALGDILGVVGVNHSENPSAHRAWFADPARSGGGAVMDHVVHLADLLRWSFGLEVADVYADVRWTPNVGANGAPLDTAGVLLLTLENGVQASIDCSWSRPDTYPRWGHLAFDVVGSRGLLVVNAFADHLTAYLPREARTAQWPGFGLDPNREMLLAFLDAARTGVSPVTWNDGFEALRIALAAYESAELGQPVRLR